MNPLWKGYGYLLAQLLLIFIFFFNPCATDIICFAFFGVVMNRQEIQTRSCACPLDRENLVRNEVSLQILLQDIK